MEIMLLKILYLIEFVSLICNLKTMWWKQRHVIALVNSVSCIKRISCKKRIAILIVYIYTLKKLRVARIETLETGFNYFYVFIKFKCSL